MTGCLTSGLMAEGMDGWLKEWMDGWLIRWIDEQIDR